MKSSYCKFFEELKKTPILSLQYCLEMDLVHASKTCEEYYRVLNVPNANQNTLELLNNRGDRIKEPKVVSDVISNVRPADFPISFKKIGVELSARIGKVIR